jgi:hypothetical protein
VAIEHYLTYQHNVQRYFRDHAGKYDGIIIPMSIAVSFPGGTYGFIRALCARDRTKRYAIDPRTPLFQKAWDRRQARAPHERMVEELGEPFTSKGLAGPLAPTDFEDEALTIAVHRCIAYQKEFRASEEDQRKLNKYKKLLGVENLGQLQEPLFLIPPYFQFNDETDPWFGISLRAVELSQAVADGIPLRPVIHPRNWDAVIDWPSLLNRLKVTGCRDAWLYPNNFKEHDATLPELQSYRAAVEACVRGDINPYSLFGGYYAILLGTFGLKGFANGIGYGEWRDSGYHRGGTAILRIYMPRLHKYLDVPAAQNLLDKDADYFAGDSDLLSECASGGRPLADLSQEECLDHFLECRRDEIAFVDLQGLAPARAELQETLNKLTGVGPFERQTYGPSLEQWHAATA